MEVSTKENLNYESMEKESIIRTDKLEYSYAKHDDDTLPRLVIDDVSLDIKRGTFVAVIGRNGSGKSTLAKHFNALLLPQGGSVHVCGMDTTIDNFIIEIRRRIGMVFQNPDNQMVATIVEEDVAFAPENLGIAPDEIRLRVDEALKIVGMYEYRKHAPHLLSGGQKQRIAIAGVLAMKPQCVVFDEPTAMLDPKGRESVMRVLKELRDNYNVTVILITHHMSEASLADRVIVMSEGKLLRDGTPEEVFVDFETLQSAGLDIPETARLLRELSDGGIDIPLDALSVENCADTIVSSFKKQLYKDHLKWLSHEKQQEKLHAKQKGKQLSRKLGKQLDMLLQTREL